MLRMTQMDMANNILSVMNDLDNYPDHAPADVLPDPGDNAYGDDDQQSPSWRFTDDGILQTIDDATGDWAYAGSLDDDVWSYRKNQPGI